jgi:hypothetical protein
MEKLTYERLCTLPSGSEILERYHNEWGGKDGESTFKLGFKKGSPRLLGMYGGSYGVKPQDFEKSEYYLVKLGTHKGGRSYNVVRRNES